MTRKDAQGLPVVKVMSVQGIVRRLSPFIPRSLKLQIAPHGIDGIAGSDFSVFNYRGAHPTFSRRVYPETTRSTLLARSVNISGRNHRLPKIRFIDLKGT